MKFVSVALAVIAGLCFIAAVWMASLGWQFIGTGFLLLLGSILVASQRNAAPQVAPPALAVTVETGFRDDIEQITEADIVRELKRIQGTGL